MIRSSSLVLALIVVSLSSLGQAQLEDCTLCADGNEPISDVSTSPCSDIGSSIAGLVQSDNSCKDQQLAAYQAGCCRDPPFEYCPVCPDGTPIPEPLNGVPIGTNPADEPNCREVQYRRETLIGVFEQGTCADTFLQRGSFYCGCPNIEQQCWLCPDKNPPGNPDRGDAFATNSRCRGINYLFSIFNADECATLPDVFGVDLAAFCLCGGLDEESENAEVTTDEDPYQCSFCEGGGQVVDPDLVYTDESDFFERRCGQAQDYAQYVTTERACTDLFERARQTCQCTGGSSGAVLLGHSSGLSAMGLAAAVGLAAVLAE